MRYRSTWRGKLVLQIEVDVFVFGLGWRREWRDATVSDLDLARDKAFA
ncbi:MAG TPA: hypothetical protein VD838_09145 [Anaeromyxobacteraceae bacterium]|nr:hypothetical protein [Anaeromyxobacteraceae bacterium]